MNGPELLMPAGSLKKLQFAYSYGADAAYVGIPLFSLRARENEFSLEKLREAITLARSLNKKLYVTANIFARNRKIQAFEKQINDWAALKPDALIMSDPGLISMVRTKHPDIPIHLSVQANCMNWQAVKFWHEHLGVTRVILSRELQLNEIREIKDKVPTVELEAFVHGAICIAYSGRCLMSSYFSYRDANQGVCDNSCREKFHIFEAPKQENKEYFVEDLRNKGLFYQIDEDENGTYIMNAKDLRLIEYMKEIADAGVCSFKVEGRTKSEYYVAMVTRAYRQAIDDMYAGKPFNKDLLGELDKVANRGYHTGFMITNPSEEGQNYDTSVPRYYTQKFGGFINSDAAPQGYRALEVRNKIKLGDRGELLTPSNHSVDFEIKSILNQKLEPVAEAHGGAGVCFVECAEEVPAMTIFSLKLNERSTAAGSQ
jgi:putative protease